MLNIEKKVEPPSFALFELGFRPFFAVAGLFAVVSVAWWMAVYVFGQPLSPSGVAPMHWHGHEMVFGYAMAVVAGFLLTAVVNWTGVMTVRRAPLAVLVALWLLARVAAYLPLEFAFQIAALADFAFVIGLVVATAIPVWKVRQWSQLGILSKLVLMLAANLLFYAGVFGYLEQGVTWGLYSGLYVLIGLVFVMGRRVIPFFIERGVDEDCALRNRSWVDVSSLVLFVAWFVLEVFTSQAQLVALLSLLLFAIHALRLWDWHTPGIWRKPLLWSLYLGYGFMLLGFLLKALGIWLGHAPSLALHAFAYGAVGLVTIGMMARVALGHSGRNVFDPPRILVPVFALVLAGALVRVLLPLLLPQYYNAWIAASQLLWIAGFGVFTLIYLPILWQPRIDGRPG
ncbi:MAG: NnrS family protein [Gammaproteobacteria bacterium]|nr:NnrS family protein [Gammaproteobacteria bacterium]